MKSRLMLIGVVGVVAGIVAGVAMERVRRPREVGASAPSPASMSVENETNGKRDLMSLRSANDALRTENVTLRRRLAEIESNVRGNEVDIETDPLEQPAETAAAIEPRPQREGFAQRMERMRTEDPEGYAAMQQRRQEFRERMERRVNDRNDFLAAVDTANMSAAQRENHEKLLEAVSRVNELVEQASQSEDGDRRSLWREVGRVSRELNALYQEERRYLFEETARSAGYKGDEAASFANHLQMIIENTSVMPGGHRGGWGVGGRGR